MKKSILFGLAVSATLVLTGCESSKEEILKKDHIAIIHNVDSLYCNSFVVDYVKKKYNYTGEILYRSMDDNTSCSDDGFKDTDCIEKTNTEEDFSGNSACVLAGDGIVDDK